MLKVFLVDDEKMVLQAMSQLIEWEKIGLELVGMAENGQIALEFLAENQVDIVITDVKMPLRSGLELIRYSYEQKYNTQFIILSGYGDFEYARDAMKYGVKDYLLKPCNVEEIELALIKIKKDIRRKKDINRSENVYIEPDKIGAQKEDCVAKIKLCVEKHLANPEMSLKWIAQNHIYMNSDYLGKQFLKETGEKFSVYLNKKRVERAIALISIWDYEKVYQIAEQVGLGHNPQYFSQVFKKYTGYLPSEYQKNRGRD